MGSPSTYCAVPAQLRDEHLERAVICGILRDAEAMFTRLAAIEFKAEHYGYPAHAVVHDELHEMWVDFQEPALVPVYKRLQRLRTVGKKVASVAEVHFGRGQWAKWLAQTYLWDGWFDDIFKWWPQDVDIVDNGGQDELTTCVGLAAARKVMNLASRRQAIYRANEVVADAVDGARETEYFRFFGESQPQGEQ